MDFYTPRYFRYRLFIQALTPLQRLKTLVHCVRRSLAGDLLTLKGFRAEIAEADLCADDNGDLLRSDSKWTMCRLIEGNNFGTFIGRYFEPFLLRHEHASPADHGGKLANALTAP